MLIIGRAENECIFLDTGICVQVVNFDERRRRVGVRIGAPKDVGIVRAELFRDSEGLPKDLTPDELFRRYLEYIALDNRPKIG